MQIRKQFKFESAHVLPHHPGKCARLHGHSYRLDVGIRGPLQTSGPAQGMVEDFDTLATIVEREVVEPLDHRNLNDIVENPTCERILEWIWDRLAAHLPGMDEVILWETATSCAVLRAGDRSAP